MPKAFLEKRRSSAPEIACGMDRQECLSHGAEAAPWEHKAGRACKAVQSQAEPGTEGLRPFEFVSNFDIRISDFLVGIRP